jgi:hypothetical protein
MRGQELLNHVTQVIQETFDDDVATALLSDDDTFENLARHLNRTYSYSGITAAVQRVADNLDGDTADWLVEHADNPAAWLYRQV